LVAADILSNEDAFGPRGRCAIGRTSAVSRLNKQKIDVVFGPFALFHCPLGVLKECESRHIRIRFGDRLYYLYYVS
jgi:hypothetical protein